ASGTSVVVRVVRIVVPWILLLVVGSVLWSLVEDYRAATDAAEPEESTETTGQAGTVFAQRMAWKDGSRPVAATHSS
ncbi:MAG: hypothetical protein WBJ62_09625, partial [Coriobacteriia bacterium]